MYEESTCVISTTGKQAGGGFERHVSGIHGAHKTVAIATDNGRIKRFELIRLIEVPS